MAKAPPTPVIIRYEGKGRAERRDWRLYDLVAVFPANVGTNDPRTMSCYSIDEQHVTCQARYVGLKTKPATPTQTEAMLAHLRHIGYDNLLVIQHANRWHARARREQLKAKK